MPIEIKNFRTDEYKEAAKQHGLKNIYEDKFFRITCYEGEGHEVVKAIKADGYLIPTVNTAFTGTVRAFHTLMKDHGYCLRARPSTFSNIINQMKDILKR